MVQKAKKLNVGQWLAVGVWFLGLATTIAFIHSLDFQVFSNAFLRWTFEILVSLVLQGVLTFLESPIWEWEWNYPSSWFCLVVDVFINLNGAWVIAKGLPKTGSASAIKDITGTVLNPAGGGFSALVVCFAVALAISALPEALWRLEERRKRQAILKLQGKRKKEPRERRDELAELLEEPI